MIKCHCLSILQQYFEPSGQVLIGGVETIITEAGCITTPSPSDTGADDGTGTGGYQCVDPGDGDNHGKYPVVLKLDDLIIDDPGEGYEDSNDTIVIEPSFGAEAGVSFDDQRKISKIKL